MQYFRAIGVFLCVFFLYLRPAPTLADPFSDCPSEAYLIQDTVARIYGVNLATGYYQELSNNMGTNGKINAVGFNVHDNYLYGFGYESNTLVQIGSDFIALPLSVSGLPNVSFFVGDTALAENAYYAYRKGSSYGLYKIALDGSDPDYFVAQRIINGGALSLNIYDFAFHSSNNQLYSVDRNGNLWSISAQTGQALSLGNVGESGTFGAVYFDLEGNFYISRNSDGYIFRIDVTSSSPAAEFFAFGPSSGNNDGARCALAPILSDVATVDFGNAPDSYGTTIANNGARHEQQDDMYLGTDWGGGSDGVEPLTSIEVGTDAVVSTQVKGSGYINAWADWDGSGTFDDTEQVVVDQAVEEGANLVLVPIPADAVVGNTWSRYRFSSTKGVGPKGGVSDGEVEDYQIEVLDSGVSVQTYPSTSTFATVAFEDNWPEIGDFDMNDAVLALRTHRFTNINNEVIRYDIEGQVLALGAGYHNGFAVLLDGISTGNVDLSKSSFYINGLKSSQTLVEENLASDDVVLVLFNDLKARLPTSTDCTYYRTQDGCDLFEAVYETFFRASITLVQGVPVESAPTGILNPFIFATEGIYHGDAFDSPPGRNLEIHLKNKPTSSRFNTDFYNIADDNSILGIATFVTANYMPWAMEMPTLWQHPKERIDLTEAYPSFKQFIQSNGAQSATWYLEGNAEPTKIINNNSQR